MVLWDTAASPLNPNPNSTARAVHPFPRFVTVLRVHTVLRRKIEPGRTISGSPSCFDKLFLFACMDYEIASVTTLMH